MRTDIIVNNEIRERERKEFLFSYTRWPGIWPWNGKGDDFPLLRKIIQPINTKIKPNAEPTAMPTTSPLVKRIGLSPPRMKLEKKKVRIRLKVCDFSTNWDKTEKQNRVFKQAINCISSISVIEEPRLIHFYWLFKSSHWYFGLRLISFVWYMWILWWLPRYCH